MARWPQLDLETTDAGGGRRSKPRKDDRRKHTLSNITEMASYIWSSTIVAWTKDHAAAAHCEGLSGRAPVSLNQTPIAAPMHLGHEFQVVEINGREISGRSARH